MKMTFSGNYLSLSGSFGGLLHHMAIIIPVGSWLFKSRLHSRTHLVGGLEHFLFSLFWE
jgi:hypothetical protein